MKNSLLSLICVVAGAFGLSAAEVTDVLTNAGFGIGKTTSYKTYADKQFSSDAVYTMQGAGDAETLQLRTKNNNSGIVSTVSGGQLVSVSVKWNAKTGDARILDIYGSNVAYTDPADLYSAEKAGTKIGSLAMADGDKTFTVAGDYAFVGVRSNDGALYMDEVSIVWETGGEVTTVSRPVIAPNGGEISATTEISISCATDAADIWYAYIPAGADASTVEKQKYTAPFTIPASGTVEAIAKKDGLTDSDVVSAVFTIPAEVTVGNIAEAVALNDTENIVTIAGEVAVTYVNGLNIYVKDSTGAMCLYDNGKVFADVKQGDRLTGVTGKYLKYSSGTKGDAFIPEMKDFVAGKATVVAGDVVEPDVVAIEEIGTDMGAAYIKIENADVASNSITDATGTVTLYNSFKITLTLGKAKSVTAIVMAYQGALQVAPIEIIPDESGDNPGTDPVKGDKEMPYTVAEALALYQADNAVKKSGWLEGFIVGYVNGSALNETTAQFNATEVALATNIMLAASDSETDYTQCIPVQLPAGDIRTALNLKDNAGMYKAQVKIQGSIEKYMGACGLKSASAYEVVKTSGIDTLGDSAESVSVNGMVGAVSVTGFDGVVEIYNTLGQLVAIAPVSGNAEIPARAGLAIVKAGNVVAKVIVK